MTPVVTARDVVLRHVAALDARDMAAYGDTLTEDVVVTIDSGSVVAVQDDAERPLRVGARRPLASSPTPFDGLAGETGCTSSLTVPIVIRDAVWGLGFVGWRDPRPIDGVRVRLEAVLEVAATVLAGLQALGEARALADEQAALRRVAEVAARGAAPEDVFLAVSREASGVLGTSSTVLCRFDPDGTPVVVADDGGLFAVGTAGSSRGGTLAEQVQRTGRPARDDDYARVAGGQVIRDAGIRAAVAAPVTVEGRLWGMLVANSLGEPLPRGTEARLAEFAELVALAIANAAARSDLMASRRRVLASGDEARRRLQRDVHDGAQQRLVQTVIVRGMATERLAEGPGTDVSGLLAEALEHAEAANLRLREVLQGILPASLSRRGLRAAFETLAAGVPLVVDVRVDAGRLPAEVETTAYFVGAEALTNIVKHAQAAGPRRGRRGAAAAPEPARRRHDRRGRPPPADRGRVTGQATSSRRGAPRARRPPASRRR